MNLRRLICVFSLFAILALASQDFLAEDLNVTVTHPSVFHEEFRDYRITIQANENNPMIRRKAHKPLNLTELISDFANGRPLNLSDISLTSSDTSSEDYSEGTSEDTSLCSSDFASDDAYRPENRSSQYFNSTEERFSNASGLNMSRFNDSNDYYDEGTSDDTSLCSSDLASDDAYRSENRSRQYLNYTEERFSNFSGLNMSRFNDSNAYYDDDEGTSDDTSLCSSDFASDDTSEGTSDSDSKILSALIGAAKDLQEKVSMEANKQLRLTKLQAKKNWDALKYKIIREARAAEIPTEEIKQQLKDAKREVRSAWRDFKMKVKNGSDILDELLENTDPLNPNLYNRGNTEPANATYRPIA